MLTAPTEPLSKPLSASGRCLLTPPFFFNLQGIHGRGHGRGNGHGHGFFETACSDPVLVGWQKRADPRN
jgi:hypothetical protein